MDWTVVWLIWLLIGLTFVVWFAIYEYRAIKNQERGDTFSEKTREWMRTDTPGGKLTFLVLELFLSASLILVLLWFPGHILRWY